MKVQPENVGDLVEFGARRHPNRPALRSRDGQLRTYADLDERSSRFANALIGLGLSRGERIAAWMDDRFEYIELYLAAAKAGLVVCPINARYVASEAAYLLADSEARLLVWTPDQDEKVAELDAGIWSETIAVRVGGRTRGDRGSGPSHGVLRSEAPVARTTDYESLVSTASAARPAVLIEPDDLFILGYTSGTTGRPKGAMLTHGSVLALGVQNSISYRFGEYPTVALTGSMSFVSVIPAQVLTTLRMGGTLTVMGTWAPADLLDTIRRDRISFTYIPSPLLGELTELLDRDREAWRTLETVLHSASKADPTHLAALYSVIGSRLLEGWGMTEHSGGLAAATTERDYFGATSTSPVFGSVGRPAFNVDVRVIGTDGHPAPADGDTVGELLIASPALMSGYWKNPEASRAALQNGWFHSGDLGTIDPDGYVHVTDRRNDLIVSGGMNVYPSELEHYIATLPGVRRVAVVGAPHPRWGQTVVAVVVADPAARLTEEIVIEYCRRGMASYKKPSRVLFVSQLPETTSRKVARQELREQVRQALGVD
ncbi:MAG: AMP-binding protein [Subtercola sp.]|nr:AMP-binding protein [Subtercola sp.]